MQRATTQQEQQQPAAGAKMWSLLGGQGHRDAGNLVLRLRSVLRDMPSAFVRLCLAMALTTMIAYVPDDQSARFPKHIHARTSPFFASSVVVDCRQEACKRPNYVAPAGHGMLLSGPAALRNSWNCVTLHD